MNIFDTLKDYLLEQVDKYNLDMDMISIVSKSLSAKEAIGNTKRKDFPIIVGKEIMLEADFKGAKGQAFTSNPAIFEGSLKEILSLDLHASSHDRSLFIASLNAVMRHLGMTDRTIHCKNNEPEICAKNFPKVIKSKFNNPKVAIIGYQPAIIDNVKDFFETRVLDLNPEFIDTIQYNVKIEDGIRDYEDVISWADIIICTGSTLCNNSIVNFISLNKPVYYYGTTIAGASNILGLKRLCFCSK
ncbi:MULTISPECIES: Rossmann-like domain-containing protein [unclassified Clostridioides]|uniref:Rossmann-like domain-containing protein n=1 Tax=unclassified Clostridioides TaxID=2635829 RepID=UPI001CA4F56D|nr:DUF364 domain-containing protein [Clostridioides difficile]